MPTFAISISDEHLTKLHSLARQAAVSPEEFLRHRIEQLLDQSDDPFHQAAAYVLAKNAELYRRLS